MYVKGGLNIIFILSLCLNATPKVMPVHRRTIIRHVLSVGAVLHYQFTLGFKWVPRSKLLMGPSFLTMVFMERSTSVVICLRKFIVAIDPCFSTAYCTGNPVNLMVMVLVRDEI